MAHLSKDQVLQKLEDDGPLGIQYIDLEEHIELDDVLACFDSVTSHLKELESEGLVKINRASSGGLDTWEIV